MYSSAKLGRFQIGFDLGLHPQIFKFYIPKLVNLRIYEHIVSSALEEITEMLDNTESADSDSEFDEDNVSIDSLAGDDIAEYRDLIETLSGA